MIDPSEGKRFLQGLPSTTGDGSGWTPLSATEFAAELARTHPDYEIDPAQKPMPGGMGAVYRARDKRDGRPIAIKVLRHDRVDHEAFLHRFKSESKMLQGLDHPHVVKIRDSGETAAGTPFFVMEWLDGQTLAKVLAGPARLTRRQKLELMAGLCAGVEYVHQKGIIHRDLKAQNILIVTADGRPVILDFGVARDVSQGTSAVSREHGSPGTHGHMAPELFLNPPVVKPGADVYSLAVVFLEMITGQLPLAGHAWPSAFEFTSAMDDVVRKALSHAPADRYKTVAEFATEIQMAAEPVSQAANRAEPPPMLPPMKSFSPTPTPTAPASKPTIEGTRAIQFPSREELHRLQSLLASVSAGKSAPRNHSSPDWAACSRLALKELGRNDASQKAPRSTPSIVSPKLLSWSPDGRNLVTACGAWGCTYWDAERLSQSWHYHPASCYGEPTRILWSENGNRFSLGGRTAQASYVSIYDASYGQSSECPPPTTACGLYSMQYAEPWNRHEIFLFSPWRPGTMSILVPNSRALTLIEASSIEVPRERTWMERMGFKATSKSPVLEDAGRFSIGIETLGSMDHSIEGLFWHPSGQFLALTTSDGSSGSVRNVRIVHFESAAVLATISGATACGWNRTGGLLLLDFGQRDTGANSEPVAQRFAVWDAVRFSVRPITDDEAASEGLGHRIASISSNAKSNATGDLIVRQQNRTSQIVRRADSAVLATLPEGIADIAWSPTDPTRLATVGGNEAPNDLRVWNLSGSA